MVTPLALAGTHITVALGPGLPRPPARVRRAVHIAEVATRPGRSRPNALAPVAVTTSRPSDDVGVTPVLEFLIVVSPVAVAGAVGAPIGPAMARRAAVAADMVGRASAIQAAALEADVPPATRRATAAQAPVADETHRLPVTGGAAGTYARLEGGAAGPAGGLHGPVSPTPPVAVGAMEVRAGALQVPVVADIEALRPFRGRAPLEGLAATVLVGLATRPRDVGARPPTGPSTGDDGMAPVHDTPAVVLETVDRPAFRVRPPRGGVTVDGVPGLARPVPALARRHIKVDIA